MIDAHPHGARLVQFPQGAPSPATPGTPKAKRELAGWPVDWRPYANSWS